MKLKELLSTLKHDWARNKNNTKGLFIVTFFRIANFGSDRKKYTILWFLGLPIVLAYKLLVEWLMTVELQIRTGVGSGLVIYHGQGLVVEESSIIGKNATLRHCTTIGNLRDSAGSQHDFRTSPIIGDNVDIGANCVILGNITVGKNSLIGAGSVVLKSIPDNAVVVGNPAKVIKINGKNT